jgi:hypothetical protein
MLNLNPPLASRRTAMTTLTINDLSRAEELDRKAMAGVRGGWSSLAHPGDPTNPIYQPGDPIAPTDPIYQPGDPYRVMF